MRGSRPDQAYAPDVGGNDLGQWYSGRECGGSMVGGSAILVICICLRLLYAPGFSRTAAVMFS